MKRISLMLLFAAVGLAADKMTAPQLIELSRGNSGAFREALVQTLGPAEIQKGTAFVGRGADFVWAVSAASRPELLVDGGAGPAMRQIEGSDIWYAAGTLSTGGSHTFEYKIDGKMFGGRKDVPAYAPDSYLKSGVPAGTLSEKLIHTRSLSEID